MSERITGAVIEPEQPEMKVEDKLSEVGLAEAKRRVAEKRRHDNHQRKCGTPTVRAIMCMRCRKSYGVTLLKRGNGYICRECLRGRG